MHAHAQWWERKGRGVLCEFEGAGFEGAADFVQLGVNVTVLGPGEPLGMYHYENDQEDFLVLAGEALAIVEGEERPLRGVGFPALPSRDESHDRRRRRTALAWCSPSARATARPAQTGAPTPWMKSRSATESASSGRRPTRRRRMPLFLQAG